MALVTIDIDFLVAVFQCSEVLQAIVMVMIEQIR